jgi:hypothetical protein
MMDAAKRKKYLKDLSADIKQRLNQRNAWLSNGGNYINTFMNGRN